MQTGYLSKARMQPLTSTFCFVLLGLVQSQIRNLQSIIVLPGVLPYSTSSWVTHSLSTNCSSTSIRIALVGHTWAQTPHPLQY
jgi:hypothetical protein